MEGPVRRAIGALLLILSFVCGARSARAHAPADARIAWITGQIERHPGQAELYMERGDLYRESGDRARARADYLRARRLGPELASIDLRLGILALEDGRPGAALRLFDRSLRSRPGDAAAYRLRARALQDLGRPLEAAAAFQRAMAVTPPDRVWPEDYLAWARALEAGGRRSEAIEALDEGMRRLGSIVSLQLPAIALDLDLGRVEEALGRLDALRAGPGRPEVWLGRRGEILEAAGRAAEAHGAYAEALELLRSRGAVERGRALEDLEAALRTALWRTAPAEATIPRQR
jgi:tetratricopeptide (TPR) repeat protein